MLNLLEIEPVLVSNEIDSDTEMTKTTRPPNTVQVSLRHLWKVKVDDNIHSLDINSSREEIWRTKEIENVCLVLMAG